MDTPTILEGWKKYRTQAMSATAPAIQLHECQLAFYAGATVLLGIMTSLGEADVPTEVGVETMRALLNEVTNFRNLVLVGKPPDAKNT